MSYHGRRGYSTRWSRLRKDETDQMKEQTENPRIQVISPQKKLHDIQQVISSLSETSLTMMELSEAIQKILNGEIE